MDLIMCKTNANVIKLLSTVCSSVSCFNIALTYLLRLCDLQEYSGLTCCLAQRQRVV